MWLGESFVSSPIKGKGETNISISQIVGLGFLESASSMRFLRFYALTIKDFFLIIKSI